MLAAGSWRCWPAAALALLTACAAAPSLLQLAPAQLPGIDVPVLQGTLAVPEDPGLVGGRTIPLRFLVLPARHPCGRPPLYFIDGGPGLAATGAAAWFASDEAALRDERDIVLIDVRGTGASGALQLAPTDATPLLAALGEMYPPDWVAAGRTALEQRADLRCYTTEHVVADLEAVRAALGHQRIDLHGLSYGTRVVLGYLRRHADRVHAAILQGCAPASLHIPAQHALAGQAALDGLFAEVAADPVAHARFGDLAAKSRDVVERLRAAPEHATFADPVSGRTLDVTLHADAFAERLRVLLYSRATSQMVPLLVQRAWEGRWETFLRVVARLSRSGAGPPLAEGMYLCVTCAEDVPFVAPERAQAAARLTIFGDYRIRQQLRAYSLWPRADLPPDFFSPVVTDVPVLLLAGGLDPVTPVSFAEEVAASLPRSRVVTIARMGHVEDGLSSLECLDGLMRDFLDRGSVEGLDPSCLESMQAGPWILDEAELLPGSG